MKYTDISVIPNTKVIELLNTADNGLTHLQVESLSKKYGRNEISAYSTGLIKIIISQFKSSFIYLLLAAVAISFFLREFVDAYIIIGFVSLNTLLGVWQEYKATVSLNKLRELISKTSTVVRDGKSETINDVDIVPGDILLLKAGDLIPAEVRFLSGENVSVDESILTGETIPAYKTFDSVEILPTGLGEAKNIGFSGTLVTTGEGRAVVFATGNETEVGKISKLTVESETKSGFSVEISRLSKSIIYLMVATIALLFVLHLVFRPSQIFIGDLAVFAIALAVGVIPEALPLVITISLSTGALRLAKKHVVPKRLSSIEDLGSIDILCTDKTGTITQNKLTISGYYSKNKNNLYKLALWTINTADSKTHLNEPFDKAIWESTKELYEQTLYGMKAISELPFDPKRKRSSVLLESSGNYILISRGAAEELLPLCNNVDRNESKDIANFIVTAGNSGNRVLCFCHKDLQELPGNISDQEKDLKFDGAISFMDPLKPTAKDTILQAEKLGIGIKILTGDSFEVACALGKSINLIKDETEAISGKEYEKFTEDQKQSCVIRRHVFARVTPEQKFDILQRLQKEHMVGFMGEGFNDAPAIKKAHVGLVVNNASDVSKEAADIILLSKDLHTVVMGIKEGRKTFTNTVKYIRTTLASNFGNFFAVAFSSLLVPFLPMLPIQILLLNLFSDFPMVSISTDNVDIEDLEKPKKYDIKSIIVLSLILGVVSTFFDFATFGYFLKFGEKSLQTMWFITSVLTELVLLFSIRTTKFFLKSVRPRNFIIVLTFVVGILTVGIPYSTFGRHFFYFVQPQINMLVAVFVIVVMYFITTETTKLFYFKKLAK